MSKKDKNKNWESKVKPIDAVLTEDAKINIEEEKEKAEADLQKYNLEPADLGNWDKEKSDEAEKTHDFEKYLNYLKEINKKYRAIYKDAEETSGKTKQLNVEVAEEKKKVDEDRASLEKRIEAVNDREKKLDERDLAGDGEAYSGFMKKLIESLKSTEQEIADSTGALLNDVTTAHAEYCEVMKSTVNEKIELEKYKKELERERKKWECDKQIYEENLKDSFEDKYKEKDSEMSFLRRSVKNLEKENEEYKNKIDKLMAVFKCDEEEIYETCQSMREKNDSLQEELDLRPQIDEIDRLKKQNEEMTSILEKYKAQIMENDSQILKKRFEADDHYVLEINSYKSKLESCGNIEKSNQSIIESQTKQIEDLTKTIDQLKDSASGKTAFDFASKVDEDKVYQNQCDVKTEKLGLSDVVSYLQGKMQYSDTAFYYDKPTICTFIAGLHMSPLSILQGISGTGKTSLPREVAKAMTCGSSDYQNLYENSPQAPYRICAIQSGWRDNIDLLGNYNSFEKKYNETDFFKALYLANQPKYKDTLFFIILDEMNLSRPEHYFADFLSLLEQSEDQRSVSINAHVEDFPKFIQGGKLKVPNNVRFIGTANHDETTLDFAPKTYDRSNVMEMPKNVNKEKIKNPDSMFISYRFLNRKFIEAVNNHEHDSSKFRDFLNSDDIKLLLEDKGIGVGNRFESQAEKFIGVYVECRGTENALAEAVDHLVTSRLFRTLKNRYDLDKKDLQDFRDGYNQCFKNEFGCDPKSAISLLNAEICKK